MAKPLWSYDKKARVYRDLTSGKFIGHAGMVALRDNFTDRMIDNVAALAADVANGTISADDWLLAMRQTVKSTFADQYVLGRGGRNMMTQRDWGRVGQMVRSQCQYLQGFYHDIVTKNLSEAQIAVRSALYIESSTQSYEKGRSESFGGLVLPEYPGDGSQECKARCRCHWRIKDAGTAWHATWVLEPLAHHCVSCLDNAKKWQLLIIPKQFAAGNV